MIVRHLIVEGIYHDNIALPIDHSRSRAELRRSILTPSTPAQDLRAILDHSPFFLFRFLKTFVDADGSPRGFGERPWLAKNKPAFTAKDNQDPSKWPARAPYAGVRGQA